MSSAGRKILDGLRDAVAGNFVRVSIPDDAGNMQTWVREDIVAAPDQAAIDTLQSAAKEWREKHAVIPRSHLEALMALRVTATCLTARADSVVRTDAVGNRFRSVFADDITAMEAALRAASIEVKDSTGRR